MGARPQKGYIDEQFVRRGGSIASEKRHAVASGQFHETLNEGFHPFGGGPPGKGDGQEGRLGPSSHRSYISDIDRGGLPAKVERADVVQQKMPVLDKQVRGHEGIPPLLLGDNGAVVTYAGDSAWYAGFDFGAYAPDEFEFSCM